MSCLLLGDPDKVHGIEDDMESFIHVLMHHGLRYFKHSYTGNLRSAFQQIYNHAYHSCGAVLGGDAKMNLLMYRAFVGHHFAFTSFGPDEHPLTRIVTAAMGGMRDRLLRFSYAAYCPGEPCLLVENDHEFESRDLSDLLLSALDKGVWPEDDKVGDQLNLW